MYVFSCHNVCILCVHVCHSVHMHVCCMCACVLCVRGSVLVRALYVCVCVCVCILMCLSIFMVLLNPFCFFILVTIDMTRVLTAVLLQETQPQDSHGKPTITSLYTNWSVLVIVVMAS